MQKQAMSGILTVTLLLTLVNRVRAGFEHTCPSGTYSEANLTCFRSISQFIYDGCNLQESGSVVVRAGTEPGIFIDVDAANNLLSYKLSNGRQVGLVCECCVHRCGISEFDQYCGPMQNAHRLSRRLRRNTVSRRSKYFTNSAIEKVYDAINRSIYDPDETDTAVNGISVKKFEELSQIKEWKLKSIENELRTELGLSAEDAKKEDNSESSPLAKVTAATHASKPKLFPVTNKATHPTPHRHRRKYFALIADI